MRDMRILSPLMILLFCGLAFGQQNDTSLLNKLKVVEESKYVVVHAFIGEKDTCHFYTRQMDSLKRTVQEEVDFSCYGFKDRESTFYAYEEGSMTILIADDQGPREAVMYLLNEHDLPTYVITNHYRTNDSSFSHYEYFYGEYDQPDSSIMTHIDQQKDTQVQKTIARFDSYGQPVQVIAVDMEDNLLSQLSTEYRDSGIVASVANTTYGDKSSFTQTYYEYDQYDRVVISYNTVNQRQEYFYREDGLLSNIMNYNPKGELESEIIYRYVFE